MVIFAVTKDGFLELEATIKTGKYPIWIGGSVLSESELASYREKGLDITSFNDKIDPENDEQLDDALTTITEHHPNERVWLEYKP